MPDSLEVLDIFLQPGEFYFGEAGSRVRTLLGSCVSMTLWHPRKRIGGMCHYLLPRKQARESQQNLDGRYAEDAMQMFLNELSRTRTKPGEYKVRLFGGGNMFAKVKRSCNRNSVSEKNIDFARQLMKDHGFKIDGEDMGGIGHRNVILDLSSGDVWVKRAEVSV